MLNELNGIKRKEKKRKLREYAKWQLPYYHNLSYLIQLCRFNSNDECIWIQNWLQFKLNCCWVWFLIIHQIDRASNVDESTFVIMMEVMFQCFVVTLSNKYYFIDWIIERIEYMKYENEKKISLIWMCRPHIWFNRRSIVIEMKRNNKCFVIYIRKTSPSQCLLFLLNFITCNFDLDFNVFVIVILYSKKQQQQTYLIFANECNWSIKCMEWNAMAELILHFFLSFHYNFHIKCKW